MRKLFWLLISLLSGMVACGIIFSGITSSNDTTLSEDELNTTLLVMCCGSILFGAFSLYSLNMIGKIRRQSTKDKQQSDMLYEMRALRLQSVVSQRQVTPPEIDENEIQIKMASKFWKKGKQAAAIEILESMPRHAKAQEILSQIRSRQH